MESITKNRQNSCTKQSQDLKCNHLCLLSDQTENDYTCACKLGYGLNNNSEFCEPINDYLMYIENNFVKGKRFDLIFLKITCDF